jgi:hypothetical protein
MTIDPITLHQVTQQRLREQRAAAAIRRTVRRERRPASAAPRDAHLAMPVRRRDVPVGPRRA